MTSDNSYPSTINLPADPQPTVEPLEIIAQPYCTARLRYRSDFDNTRTRRNALRSRNNPNYQSPAIRIPQQYLDIAEQCSIRVCLVTVVHEATNHRYIHPYDLEDIATEHLNDRTNKGVWFPIREEDIGGIKSFPNLRIVKTKATDLINHGDLRVFDSPTQESTSQLASAKDTIAEFNLNKAQLAFTVGKKIIAKDSITIISYAHTTVFSDELFESDVPTESTTDRSHASSSSNCQIYKYTPQKGSVDGNDEVLIFYSNKIKPEKYGELQVTFECDKTDGSRWSASVLDLEVTDQMVSFRTPPFLSENTMSNTVDIILKQRKRMFQLKFEYVRTGQCPTCQGNTTQNPNKRRLSRLSTEHDESDDLMPFYPYNPEIPVSNSGPDASSIFETMNSASITPTNEDPSQIILDKLAESVASLFCNEDFRPTLRICRPFIRNRPELLHAAISNNHSDLVPKFIAIATIDLLREKNQLGETTLLHAARLNRIDIIRAILKKQNSDKLLEDINDQGQNVFHLLALNNNSDAILHLMINHLLKNSIDIQEKFDHVDADNQTPLQLAILNNNLSAIDHLLKYFNNDIHVKNNHAVDELIERVLLCMIE